MGLRILGVQKAINRFTKLEHELEDVAGETAEESAKHLYRESQVQVPKKTHALAASGRFIIRSASGPKRSWAVKYGYQVPDSSDEAVLDYAAAVHEILKASHKPPTKAKYVEDPLVQGIRSYKRAGTVEAKKAVKKVFR